MADRALGNRVDLEGGEHVPSRSPEIDITTSLGTEGQAWLCSSGSPVLRSSGHIRNAVTRRGSRHARGAEWRKQPSRLSLTTTEVG